MENFIFIVELNFAESHLEICNLWGFGFLVKFQAIVISTWYNVSDKSYYRLLAGLDISPRCSGFPLSPPPPKKKEITSTV